jgi:DNA polymerase
MEASHSDRFRRRGRSEAACDVCLGATAAQALLGRNFKVSIQRGVWVPSPLAPFVMATVHPSSLLRAPDDETRRREIHRFVADLKLIHEVLKKQKAA